MIVLSETVELSTAVDAGDVVNVLAAEVNLAWKHNLPRCNVAPEFLGWLIQEYRKLAARNVQKS